MKYVGYTLWLIVGLVIGGFGLGLLTDFRGVGAWFRATIMYRAPRTPLWPGAAVMCVIGFGIVAGVLSQMV